MIDINTVFVTIILIGIIVAGLLTIVGRGVDGSLMYWATGYGINSVAYILLALRGAIPDVLSVLIANMMIVSTYAFYAYGLLRFLRQPISLPFSALIWAPVLVIAAVFPLLWDNLEGRIIVGGIIAAFQIVILLTVLIRHDAQMVGRGKYILMAAFASGLVIALSRPLALGMDIVHIDAVDSPGLIQTMTFLSILLLNVAIALGLVLMQKEHAEAATSAIARSDELTGLPNRRCIYERLNRVMIESDRKHTFSALLLIDLNNFKAVNDQYGHAMGDELLRQAAKRIRDCIDIKDSVGRLGGDEFVVLLTDLGSDRTAANREALLKVETLELRLAEPYQLDKKLSHICSGSIGLSMLEPGQKDRETLLRDADRAMYNAKNLQRGLVSTPAFG